MPEGDNSGIAAEDLKGQHGAEIDAVERHEPLAGEAQYERHRSRDAAEQRRKRRRLQGRLQQWVETLHLGALHP